MAPTRRDAIALTERPVGTVIPKPIPSTERTFDSADDTIVAPSDAAEAIPDGGYGWIVVFACFVQTFWVNAWTGSWGILQTALLKTTMRHVPASTLSFVGSLGLALTVGLCLVCVRLAQMIGAKWTTLMGITLFGASNIIGGFSVSNVGGLFVTGILYGVGASLLYTMANNLPVQWFSDHLGTANGVAKLGGGVGATIMTVVLQLLIEKVGIAWSFRVIGFVSLASGVPAALLIKERAPNYNAPALDMRLFKDSSFSCLFVAGAIGIFALYVPSFFLPLVASSLGISASTAAGLMACFNACMALGRVGSGIACDTLGSTNTLLLTMALNAVTMLAIWPFSSSLAPLMVFAALNGMSNGAFFVSMPTAVGRLLGPGLAAAGMGMAMTGWCVGDLLGNPIAGFLIEATGADHATSIVPYRAAIFYAGSTALASTFFVLVARLRMDSNLLKKI
ncbi:Uncharacterized protein TPAR_08278 [Tolypocladium paradoxum]|uniref:Major facilitator superfamily (MFS) profile domain-containing protein n=1 Tax=Tolypocladium paradoxum TaxID=94208 RepID=A0A2S4KMU9_9HYPO|nr:Uncharacterized protein TPAR_08278 [Tolypocladium paradoxum]